MTVADSYVVRDMGPDRLSEFMARGHKERHFFPHRLVRLPKAGPDGYKLAERMCGKVNAAQLWEIVLYALPPVGDEFPTELFFDDEVVWHQQQFGLPGQVATVNLVERRPDLYAMVLMADVVQRIGRRRAFKTRVENRFAGWSRLLVQASLDFALDRGFHTLNVATADWAVEHTDPSRSVDRLLFDRVYDHSVGAPFMATRDDHWWSLDVRANATTLVRPEVATVPLDHEPVICVCHEIERGWGHRDTDPQFASAAEREAPHHLRRMLEVEADLGVRATYGIVGALMPEVRSAVEAGGHCVAFHSYDHPGPSDVEDGQLARCRDVDYRIKGYRPPQSRLTAELTCANLLFHNFEWLASSRHSLAIEEPTLREAIVHIPILFDDFGLYRGEDYETWWEAGLREVASADCAALSLHDCYGEHWLGRYRELLSMLGDLGRLRTLDDVAAEVVLRNAT
jgi:hypothetical protein